MHTLRLLTDKLRETAVAVGLLSQLYTLALPWLKSVLPYAGKYLYPTAIVAETGTVYLTVLVTINRYLGARKLHYGRRTCSKLCAVSA